MIRGRRVVRGKEGALVCPGRQMWLRSKNSAEEHHPSRIRPSWSSQGLDIGEKKPSKRYRQRGGDTYEHEDEYWPDFSEAGGRRRACSTPKFPKGAGVGNPLVHLVSPGRRELRSIRAPQHASATPRSGWAWWPDRLSLRVNLLNSFFLWQKERKEGGTAGGARTTCSVDCRDQRYCVQSRHDQARTVVR